MRIKLQNARLEKKLEIRLAAAASREKVKKINQSSNTGTWHFDKLKTRQKTRTRCLPNWKWKTWQSVATDHTTTNKPKKGIVGSHCDGTKVKVGLGIWEFWAISRRLISKIRFPHPISVADLICGTRFDLRDSKRRALENWFCVRICYMFLISKCRGDWDLGLCTTSVLALGEPKRNGKIRFFLRRNTFFFRILPSRIRSSSASTEVVHRPRSKSPLHFDIRNI